jgi:hypothetical protein
MSLFIKLPSGKFVSVEYSKLHNNIKLYDEWNDSMKVSLEELNYIKEVLRVHLKTYHGIIAISQ